MEPNDIVLAWSLSMGSSPIIYLSGNTFPLGSFCGMANISNAPCSLLSLVGKSLIGISPVGLNSTLPSLCTSSPTYTSSYSEGLLSNCFNLSLRSDTGNIVLLVCRIASWGVMGYWDMRLVMVFISVEPYLILYLSTSNSNNALVTSEFPSSSIQPSSLFK